ncbi:nicotinate-nucleotide--dimethylbenzimidazole phosphoribosyltransferase, partial [Acinetobacter baumannii]
PAGVARKVAAVDAALTLHAPHCTDPFETLRRLGGREIAAMAGAILAARMHRVPVLLDGFIASAAIAPLVAARPDFIDH